jgi:hypothetical protein
MVVPPSSESFRCHPLKEPRMERDAKRNPITAEQVFRLKRLGFTREEEVIAAIESLERSTSHPAVSPSDAEVARMARAIFSILTRVEPRPDLREEIELAWVALACLTTHPLLEALNGGGFGRELDDERITRIGGEPLGRLKSALEILAATLPDGPEGIPQCLGDEINRRVAASEHANLFALGVRRLDVARGNWLREGVRP